MNVLLCSLVQIHSCQEKKEIKCCLNYSGEIYAVGMNDKDSYCSPSL